MLVSMEAHADKPLSPQHYEKIGRFAVGFERVVNKMQLGVFVLLWENGLRDEELGRAVTAGLSAYDILTTLRSAFGVYLKRNPNDDLTKVAGALLKRVQEILARRNELLHSFWTDELSENGTVSLGYHLVRTKKGIEYRDLPSLSELDEDVKKVGVLFEMLDAFISIPISPHRPNLYRAFKFDETGNLYFDWQEARSAGFDREY